MDKTKIREKIIEQLINTVTCQHTSSYCQWRISGKWTDANKERHMESVTISDEDLATGWQADKYDRQLYVEYERKWAEYLCDRLDLVDKYLESVIVITYN